MAPAHRQLGIARLFEIYAHLGTRNGGSGLKGSPYNHRRARGKSAQNAPGVVAHRNRPAVLHAVGVVVLTAPRIAGRKTCAKLHALYGGNSKHHLGHGVFHSVKQRLTHPRRHTQGGTFHHPTHAVALRARLGDSRNHGLGGLIVNHGKGFGSRGVHLLARHLKGVEARIVNARHPRKVGTNTYPFLLQKLQGNPTRHAQRSRESSGKMPTTSHILGTTILNVSHQIGMARPGHTAELVIVGRARVGIGDRGRNRCPTGHTIDKPAPKLGQVGL